MSQHPAPAGVVVFGPYKMYGLGRGGLWRDALSTSWQLVRSFAPQQLERIQKACEANTPEWAQYLLFNLDAGTKTERGRFAEGYAWDLVREFEARATDNRIKPPAQQRKTRR